MRPENKFWILFLGVIFIAIPSFVLGLACTQDSDCLSFPGYVCRNDICSIEKGISISITVPSAPTPPPSGGGGGGVIILTSTVIFEGKAYPDAFITFLRNKTVIGTTKADLKGDFSKTFTGAPAGVWEFGIFAEDNEGRKSVTISFSTNIIGGTTMKISGIFISPTISLSTENVIRGEELDILGQAYPKSDIEIFVSSPFSILQKTKSTEKGKWQSSLDTVHLALGVHQTKARARTIEGEESYFSEELIFKIIEACKGADLNFDGKINIVDFSILLYFWGQKKPANVCTDINRDGSVNVTDFSIMMYWWSG